MKTKRNLIQICLLAAVLLPALTSEATTFVVTNTVDGGTGSLRQLVLSAAPGDTITFATNLSGSTLTLFAQLPLNNSVTIDASALPGGIQIRGQGFERIFFVLGGATVVLSSLTLTNGNDQNDSAGGGGIYNQGTLTVDRCTLTGNNANNLFFGTAGGGAIFNSGLLTLNECTLAGNHSDNDSGGNGGGAIYNSGTLNVNQCTLTTNSADFSGYGGGGIYNYSGTLNIYNSIVAGNSAIGGSGADIFSFSSIAFTGANLVEDFSGNFSGNFPINADPRLEPLGNYSGPTPTMPPLPGSPAIDGCTNGTTFATDQRGYPRSVGRAPDIGAVEGVYNPAGPGKLKNVTRLGNGSVSFTLTNYSDMSFTVLASTNVALPFGQWSNLGTAVESPLGSGQYPFTDLHATNYSRRFYKVASP